LILNGMVAANRIKQR